MNNNNNIIQCDIDGTICDTRHLTPHRLAGLLTAEHFENKTANDPKPITPVINWLHQQHNNGANIHYITARANTTRAQATLEAVGAPTGTLHTNTTGEDPARLKHDKALTLNPTYILEDDPSICTLLELTTQPGTQVIRVPGWYHGEHPNTVAGQLPHTPPATNPTGNATVALYSGGVDSYCMAVLTNPDVLLHVNLGGEYGNTETNLLETPPGQEHKLVTIDLQALSIFEMPESNHILPARNAILAILGAQYGNEVMMGSIAACHGSDKDEGFETRITELLQYVWQPQNLWNPDGRHTKLTRPVSHLTKAQLVAEAINHGAQPEDIRDKTFSCYTPADGKPCGECVPCGKKWAALAANNINPGFDGRKAYKPYWEELNKYAPNIPPNRTTQHVQDVRKAWESEW